MDGHRWSVDRWGRGGCLAEDGGKEVFLLAISGSQFNSLYRPRAPAAAAADSLIPTSPSPCRVCIQYGLCAAAVTTDTQTVQRGCAEAGMTCSGVNYP